MHAESEALVASVGQEAGNELGAAMSKILHCVQQLDDEQLWWRPAESMNSIANLMLHLGGNVRQWIVAGVGGAEDVRERQSEFDERGPIPRPQLVQLLQRVVADAK